MKIKEISNNYNKNSGAIEINFIFDNSEFERLRRDFQLFVELENEVVKNENKQFIQYKYLKELFKEIINNYIDVLIIEISLYMKIIYDGTFNEENNQYKKTLILKYNPMFIITPVELLEIIFKKIISSKIDDYLHLIHSYDLKTPVMEFNKLLEKYLEETGGHFLLELN
jgi:hypothetical protein